MISYPTPKLNFGLRILGRRQDGFHNLESLFIPCDAFRDTLEIVRADSFSIEIEPCDWDPEKDLTVRAWKLLAEEFGIGPVAIRLRKGIPVGAGLGGGSADAAFALRMLSVIFGLDLSDSQLAERAAGLGSDCPFFVYNRPMMASGRGEVLRPFDIDLSRYEIRVEVPEGVAVSTREAYAGVDSQPVTAVEGALAGQLLSGRWKEEVVNDFEPSVFAAHPEIARLKRRFYEEGAVYASMSGSGSSVFGFFRK